MKPVRKSILKLRKLKDIRRKNLEKNFLEIQMKGQDHYVFIKENGQAQVIYDQGRWVTEHIRTAVLKFNYEIDKIDKLLVKDFTDEELNEYEKTSLSDQQVFSFLISATTRLASNSISLFNNEAINIS